MIGTKETAVQDYFNNITTKSWTWARLTDDEKRRFIELIDFDRFKGTKELRIGCYNIAYFAFLVGCGYDNSSNWREDDTENVPF